MSQNALAERLVTITDVDTDGVRRPVLATSDPGIVEAVERAIVERVRRPPVRGRMELDGVAVQPGSLSVLGSGVTQSPRIEATRREPMDAGCITEPRGDAS